MKKTHFTLTVVFLFHLAGGVSSDTANPSHPNSTILNDVNEPGDSCINRKMIPYSACTFNIGNYRPFSGYDCGFEAAREVYPGQQRNLPDFRQSFGIRYPCFSVYVIRKYTCFRNG